MPRSIAFGAVLASFLALPAAAQTVLEYRFDGNLNDSSPNGLHGTWTGGGSPVYGTGPDGSPCIYLDGNHYVRRTINDPQLRLGALTVEAYIYTNSVSGKHQIADFRQANGGYNLSTYGYSGQWGFEVNGYEGYWLSTGGGLTAGRWFHLAGTRDGSGVARIYLNGVLRATLEGTDNNDNTTNPLRVGQCVFTAFNEPWIGYIDHVRISNVALSPDQFLPPMVDCNDNGLMDSYDIAAGISEDCNGNGIPDECDIAAGNSADLDHDGIPDECEAPDPFLVTSLDDPGDPTDALITLREAIEAANAAGGKVTITFAPELAGGTIQAITQLPTLAAGGTSINADVDGDGNPDIEIDGRMAGLSCGLYVTSTGNVINGLAINSFGYFGILFETTAAMDNAVAHCRIGTDLSGTSAKPSSGCGIWIRTGSSANDIGPGNTLSGNGAEGIVIDGGGCNRIIGNRIGTDTTGTAALPNSGSAIEIRAGSTGNIIGGDSPAEGNLIAGNLNPGSAGVVIHQHGTSGNIVKNNYIGSNPEASTAVPNGACGVLIYDGADSNVIGPDNVISGNGYCGVLIVDAGTTGNVVRNNRVGTDDSGTQALPNNAPGVIVSSQASGNTIGPGNLISGNNSQGIVLDGGAFENTVIGNRVGTDITGAFPIRNYWDGIVIQGAAHHNVIGGPGAGEGNLFSGNRASGIQIRNAGCDYNTIAYNLCGTDATGIWALPNLSNGITIADAASYNQVGPANVATGNRGSGVLIQGACVGNVVFENLIGLDAQQSFALGNALYGLALFSGPSASDIGPGNLIAGSSGDNVVLYGSATTENVVHENVIGTTLPKAYGGNDGVEVCTGASDNTIGPANRIANNKIAGVRITGSGSLHNTITQNSITDNGDAGILILEDAQEGIAPPVIHVVSETGVSGIANVPNGSTVEIFADPAEEGDQFVGAAVVAGGQFVYEGPVPSDLQINATVTDLDGNTSAFGFTAPRLPGDMNCDGVVNVFDIDPFVLALSYPPGYIEQYPNCNVWLADLDGDGWITVFDIGPFVQCLSGGGCPGQR